MDLFIIGAALGGLLSGSLYVVLVAAYRAGQKRGPRQ